MLKKINRILVIAVAVMLNTLLGIVGEYFGYTVLDKVGIVFIAGLCDIYTTLAVAALTPASLSIVFRDPLIAWKIPSYIIYAMFIYIAFNSILNRLEKPAFYQLFIAALFVATGLILIISGYSVSILTGISVMGFGLLLFLTYFAPFMFKYRIPMRLVGIIAILLAPFLLVMMDITLYSLMVTNILAPEWMEAFRRTLVVLIIDSAGPLILFGIIWLALDIQTIQEATKGKISDKRRFIGLLFLFLILFPVPTYLAARTMGVERKVRGQIESVLSPDWSINEMRMSYIWSPMGASGITFITFPSADHYSTESTWYQAGINFYLIQGKDIVDLDKGKVDNTTLMRLIILQFIAWLKPQKIEAKNINIITMNITGNVVLNETEYVYISMKMASYTDMAPTRRIILQVDCYVTYITELSRTGMILAYCPDTKYTDLKGEFNNILNNYRWI